MVKDIEIGQIVWFYKDYACDSRGKVIKISQNAGDVIIRSNCRNHKVLIEDCYITEKELQEGKQAKWQAEVKAYEDQMLTVEDMIRFMYDTVVAEVTEEYITDYAAREAVRNRAKALLGIELKE